MNKEALLKLIAEKRNQLKTLNEATVSEAEEEQRKANMEAARSLEAEINTLEKTVEEMNKPAERSAEANVEVRGATIVGSTVSTNENKAEERAKAFKASNHMTLKNNEYRSVLVSSGKIATPTEVSPEISNIWNTVSSIVDLVKITDAEGMGAYKVAYQTADAQAAAQTEGQSYNASDPTFDFVTITPTTEAVLSYISKQVLKQTPLNYEAKVRESALFALRKQAMNVVTNAIVNSSLVQTLNLAALDDKALRTIAFNYGGDDSIIGEAYLFLNKADLVAIGDLRSSETLRAVYEITPDEGNPNLGTIRDGGLAVRYCLDSALSSGTMLYGQGRCAELALFSDYEIRVSEDFAFDKGLLAIRGDVELGCAVIKQNGFLKVSVPVTPTSI